MQLGEEEDEAEASVTDDIDNISAEDGRMLLRMLGFSARETAATAEGTAAVAARGADNDEEESVSFEALLEQVNVSDKALLGPDAALVTAFREFGSVGKALPSVGAAEIIHTAEGVDQIDQIDQIDQTVLGPQIS